METVRQGQRVHARYRIRGEDLLSTPVCMESRAKAESFAASADRLRPARRYWSFLPCDCGVPAQ